MAALDIDPRQFRNALGAFTTGVTIVTTCDQEGRDIGLTVNSFNSVSLDPPLVLWSLAKSSASLDAFRDAKYFAVHILGADQEELSNRFAQRGIDKFEGLTPARGNGGIPLLEGCAARFECRSSFQYEGGDHEIFVGEVITFEHFDKPPLVFQGGKYAYAISKGDKGPRAQNYGDGYEHIGRHALNVLLGMAYHQLNTMLEPQLSRLNLREEQYWAISISTMGRKGRTIADLNRMVEFTGKHVSVDSVEELRARNLVELRGEGDSAQVFLTDSGNRLLMEMAAITKAIEADAEENLDYSEIQLLRQLLLRLIRSALEHEDGKSQ